MLKPNVIKSLERLWGHENSHKGGFFLLCMAIYALLLIPMESAAQDAPLRFQRLTYNDGLSDSKVNCILKSRDGFLWAGTPMGLNRYDGFRVSRYYNKPGVPTSLPGNVILSLAEEPDGSLLVETSLGYCIFDPKSGRADRDIAGWMKKHGIRRLSEHQTSVKSSFTDSRGGRWKWSQSGIFHYDKASHQWKRLEGYIVKDMAEDHEGNLLIATDHDGLLVADYSGKVRQRIVNDPADPFSLPDNTLQCVYVDNADIVWVGLYRMGLAYCYRGRRHFGLMHVGDICSMSQDVDGSLWLGTNDAGIKHIAKGGTSTIGMSESGLGSDIIVCCLSAHDGSIWFGTFQGGMARLKDGHFTVYKKGPGELASNDVWSLAELHDGRIAIGTLGGGLQILEPRTGKFVTLNTHNTRLVSDYVASIAVMPDGRLALGHSQGFSLLNINNKKVENIGVDTKKYGEKLTDMSVNQVFTDSRGLLWIATGSGLNVYDAVTRRLYKVDLRENRVHSEVSAVCEDRRGVMWLSSGNEVKSVRVNSISKSGRDGSLQWQFFVSAYDGADGLQRRLFNKRSMLCLRDGRVLVGGIDGINVINPKDVSRQSPGGKVIFSGLALFDRPIAVGDTVNGHCLLKEEINNARHLSLRYNENTFTIYLASSNPGLPESSVFQYRLKGEKQWLTSSPHDPLVKFTNMKPGHYVLEVRLANNGNNNSYDVAELDITIHPPFYFSVWAWLVYLAVAIAIGWYIVWRIRKNHRDEMEKLELRKEKELEEAKLTFFTNISHDFRTPLSLILSPVESLLRQDHNPIAIQKHRLIQRSARYLLTLTNQILDLRRIMRGKETLNVQSADVVALVRGVCADFSGLSDKGITLTFHTTADTIVVTVDQDKIQKIVINLLSNSFKFTPKGGRIDVGLETDKNDNSLSIWVADTGPGIGDDDKKHIFERFYQSNDNKQSGGSGIGLNLVYEYTKMHGGSITVTDNEPSGTVFTISIPQEETVVNKESKGYVTSFVSPSQSSVNADTHSPLNNNVAGPLSTILIVDDSSDFLSFLSSELSPYYTVRTAGDGRQALESIRQSRPDIVLTDIMMPVMDGNELCRKIKADRNLKDLPVMMLTARLSDENEIESRECGADDYVKKPFSMQLLRMRIDALLSKDRVNEDGKVKPRITQPEITSEDEKFVDKATRYVEQHLGDTDFSVEQMAQDIGMSRVHLYRRLVTVAGKTPTEFVRLIRLRHASRLLRESQLTVAEIAYKVGFSSPRYFSRCFKDLYGYMPNEYKKKNEI